METISSIFQWLIANWSLMLNAIIGLIAAIIALCLLIPGSEPETTLQKIVDFLKKFSNK